MQRKEEKDELPLETPGATNTVSSYQIVSQSIQTRNSGEVVSVSNVLDDTEGLTAMDTLPFKKGARNLDIGGGQFDEVSQHVSTWYSVMNLVYDPYNRSTQHNKSVLYAVKEEPVDSVTSNSVLNVILNDKDRKEHIQLAYQSLKSNGIAFFKVWRGNGSGIAGPAQSNLEAKHYVKEIADIFGNGNVQLIPDDIGNTIFAIKK